VLTLRSLHLFLIAVSIIVTAGIGTWGLLNHSQGLGVLFLGLSVLLIVYGAYFAARSRERHLG